jgi:ferric-dicitrate binding protein FerR (iron transport regulator)
MSKLNINFRAVMSFALTLIVAGIPALSSVAASNASGTATLENSDNLLAISILSAPTGRLMGTGHFTIDGDEAQTGATVLSGSSIATGSDGDVTIDLASLGQIVLRPETAIRLRLSKGKVEVSLDRAGSIIQLVPPGVTGRLTVQGGDARLGVSRGEAEVKGAGAKRTIQAGEVMALDRMSEVVTKGEALLMAEGGDMSASEESMAADGSKTASGTTQAPEPSEAGIVSAGLVGVIAMAGTATAITLAVVTGRNHGSKPTPPRPSGVIP